MKYQLRELAELWNLIKDHRNIYFGEYRGLTEVAFEVPIHEFGERNRDRHREAVRDMDTIVTTDINHALQLLCSVDIRCHHLSCAADTGIGDNAALCIHYMNPKDNTFYALTIPGVNYILTEKTIAMLQGNNSEDT
jgi:hypothetical protein